jgi:hypothetical protein
MNCSDCIEIVSTLVLTIVAFLAPFEAWRRRRRFLAPILNPTYVHEGPMARLSSRAVGGRPTDEPFYDFHFRLINEGRTPARRVEAILDQLWLYDASGAPIQQENFWPVNLRYDPETQRYLDVNPEREYYWNIGNIPSVNWQAGWRKSYIDVRETDSDVLRFVLDIISGPFHQANVLLPGTYGIRISLFSENANRAEILLRIVWSGEWRDEPEEMFREIVIQQVDEFIPTT